MSAKRRITHLGPSDIVFKLAQSDFALFCKLTLPVLNEHAAAQFAPYLYAVAAGLQEVDDGSVRRLLLTMPPRYLKSIMASVLFVAWSLGRHPDLRIICVSYSMDLSKLYSNQCRALMKSSMYRAIFPGTRISSTKDTETEIITTRGGGRFATSIEGTLTGRGGELIVIDDPLHANDAESEVARRRPNQWYDQTLLSRLNNKHEGKIIVVMQRLHSEDLGGHVLASGEYKELRLPAIAETNETFFYKGKIVFARAAGEALQPDRESVAHLEAERKRKGTIRFAAQHQQNPIPPGGTMIKAEWLLRYNALPIGDKIYYVIQSWDTAIKTGDDNDYSVCVTIIVDHRHMWHIAEVYRAKLTFPELRAAMEAQAKKWSPHTILIEDTANGSALIQDMKNKTRHNIIAVKPEGDKRSRLFAQTHNFECGRILLPQAAPWLDEFTNELLRFGQTRHDDQVDALVQALQDLEKRRIQYEKLANFEIISITGESRWKQKY